MPASYRTPISFEWPKPSYRAERLHEVLRDSGRFTVAEFMRLQHDDVSLLARRIAPALVEAATRAGAGDRPEVRALRSWDHRMSRDANAALVFATWSAAFARLLTDAIHPPAVAALLRSRTDWEVADSVLRAGGRGDSLAVVALDSATATVTRRLGPNGMGEPWGALHVVALRHPIAQAFDLAPYPRGGDANTVFATGGANFRQTAGASYRQIIDLGDFDQSVAINVPGQSAQPESEYYANLLPMWAEGQYFPLVFSRARVEAETKHVLRLLPTDRRAARAR